MRDGFLSSVIRRHKGMIQAYIKELGTRGILDDVEPESQEREANAAPSQVSNDKVSNAPQVSAGGLHLKQILPHS